jgi:hypothetical protein
MEELWLIRPRYWKAMLIKHSREEKRIKIFLAIVTSGTVISIFSSYPIIWKTLSVISALLAIILPFFYVECFIQLIYTDYAY